MNVVAYRPSLLDPFKLLPRPHVTPTLFLQDRGIKGVCVRLGDSNAYPRRANNMVADNSAIGARGPIPIFASDEYNTDAR